MSGKDAGSLKDFSATVDAHIEARRLYDKCMDREYWLISHGFLLAEANSSHFGRALSRARTDEGRADLLRSLSTCFGHGNLRAAALGDRHVDKGIYVDQFFRWFANFDSKLFYVTFVENLDRNPSRFFRRLLHFLQSNMSEKMDHASTVNDVVMKADKRLVSPNIIGRNISQLILKWRLSTISNETTLTSDDLDLVNLYMTIKTKLRNFYRPYNSLFVKLMLSVRLIETKAAA